MQNETVKRPVYQDLARVRVPKFNFLSLVKQEHIFLSMLKVSSDTPLFSDIAKM
jgi:hypothetical protein